MKFEYTKVYNIDGALRGMRNPKNSWDSSDSRTIQDNMGRDWAMIGDNDMKLCNSLINGGSEHRKFFKTNICQCRYCCT